MLSSKLTLTGSVAAITLLSGCLGTDNPDFNKQAIEALQFVSQLESIDTTVADEMPTTGTAEYRGVATFTYDEPRSTSNPNSDLFADVAMTANFETNDVTGTIDAFNSPEGNVAGTVDVTDGAIASSLMQANATGTITDTTGDIALDLDLDGVFRGDDAGNITGTISGTYTPEGGAEGEIFGGFGVDQ